MKSDTYTRYMTEIRPALKKDLGIENEMAIPKIVKIVVNCGLGEGLKDEKVIGKMQTQLALITGQRPTIQKAKKAISSFKLREGDAIGCKVTLRGKRMWDFLTRLIGIALPRVRDFQGVPNRGFDGNGNYTLGIPEQTIFPELDFSVVDKVRGFEVTFVTSAKNDTEGKKLLEKFGLPFEK